MIRGAASAVQEFERRVALIGVEPAGHDDLAGRTQMDLEHAPIFYMSDADTNHGSQFSPPLLIAQRGCAKAPGVTVRELSAACTVREYRRGAGPCGGAPRRSVPTRFVILSWLRSPTRW